MSASRERGAGGCVAVPFFFFFPFLSFLGRRKENVRENHQAYDYILDSPSSLPVSLSSRRLSICQHIQAHTCFGSLGVDGRRVSWKVVCFPRRLDESTSFFAEARNRSCWGLVGFQRVSSRLLKFGSRPAHLHLSPHLCKTLAVKSLFFLWRGFKHHNAVLFKQMFQASRESKDSF